MEKQEFDAQKEYLRIVEEHNKWQRQLVSKVFRICLWLFILTLTIGIIGACFLA